MRRHVHSKDSAGDGGRTIVDSDTIPSTLAQHAHHDGNKMSHLAREHVVTSCPRCQMETGQGDQAGVKGTEGDLGLVEPMRRRGHQVLLK